MQDAQNGADRHSADEAVWRGSEQLLAAGDRRWYWGWPVMEGADKRHLSHDLFAMNPGGAGKNERLLGNGLRFASPSKLAQHRRSEDRSPCSAERIAELLDYPKSTFCEPMQLLRRGSFGLGPVPHPPALDAGVPLASAVSHELRSAYGLVQDSFRPLELAERAERRADHVEEVHALRIVRGHQVERAGEEADGCAKVRTLEG